MTPTGEGSDIDIFLTKSLDVDEPRVQTGIWKGNPEHGQVSMKILNENLLSSVEPALSQTQRESAQRGQKRRERQCKNGALK